MPLGGGSIGPELLATSYGVPSDGSSDCYAPITTLLARLKAGDLKGRRIVFPYTGAGGYRTSQQITVDFPVWLHFEDDLIGTFTTPQNTLLFVGTNTYPSPLKGIRLTGNGRAKIDGNKAGITPYTHNPADTLYGSVLLKWCQDFYVAGLHFANGLVNSLRTFQSGNGLIDQCKFSGAGNDNGLSIDFDPGNYSATDPSTWANVTVRRCQAWGNNDYGMTAFDATNVTFESCYSWSNGQMTDPNGVGGGFSYEDSYSSPKGKATYQGRFRNCHGYGNTGNAFFVTADGVEIDAACTARSSVYSDVTKPDASQQFGHGVAGISVRKFRCEATVESNAKAGVKLLGANSVYCDAEIGGSIKSNSQRGVDGQGIARLRVLPTVAVESNGGGAVAAREGIYVGNTSLNVGGGTVYVDGGEISLNGAAAVKIEYANRAFINGVTGYNPGQSGITTAGIQVANATLGIIANCVIDGGSSQSYVASITSTSVGGIFNCGGRANTGTASNSATTKITAGSA